MSPSGPARLRVDGRFLALGDSRIFLKGVTFGPFPPDAPLDPVAEFPRIAGCGFNAIRLYTGADRHLLDCAHENGLLVLLGLPWEWSRDFLAEPRLRTEGELRLLEFLQEHGSHPALGALLVANEIPSDLARWMGPDRVRQALEDLISLCREEAGELPIAYANYPSTEYLEPRNADFTAFNVYLEDREALARYLPRLQNIAGDRPVLITEFGLDTLRNSEEQQAELLEGHLEECLAAGIAGTTFFSWSDRWSSRGESMTNWAFGLTRSDLSEKPALERLRERLPEAAAPRASLPLENPPRISVVVCTHNGAEILPDCLTACLALDYPDFEVLVVDDGSTDDTATVTARFPEVRYLCQDHGGLSVARNYGAQQATGELIAYTDDDCQPDRDWLFWIARAFHDPQTGAAGGPNLPPAPTGIQEAIVAAAPGAPSHVLTGDLQAEHLPGCNLVLRRTALESIGGFRSQFVTAGDDVDLCWRLLDHGWQLAFAPAAFVWHRRRTSVLRYLRQQSGYGRAEALLFEAHPGRFQQGGIAWEGSVYGGGVLSADSSSVIYFGPMGQAGYQGLAHHSIPRRLLHRQYNSPLAHLLLRLCDFFQPITRAFARWRHGGPAPRFNRPAPHGDESSQLSSEIHFLGPADASRHQLLGILQTRGWSPGGDTQRWDLESRPFHLLTTDEQHGPDHTMVKARLLHPPGLRQEGMALLHAAAREAGLEPQ